MAASRGKGGFFATLLDVVFPRECIGCGTWGTWWCAICASTVPTHLLVRAISCTDGHVVPVFAATSYREAHIEKLIAHLKFKGVIELSVPLSILIRSSYEEMRNGYLPTDTDATQTLVVPMPLAKRRFVERGYNQSVLLAQGLGDVTTDALMRTHYRKPQVGQSKMNRKSSITASDFSANADIVRDKYVLLVDDVITTGATIAAAAQALYEAGVRDVWGLVLASD